MRPSLKLTTDESPNPSIIIKQWMFWTEDMIWRMVGMLDQTIMHSRHYRFDTVDLTREALTLIFDAGVNDVIKSCNTDSTIPSTCGYFDSDCKNRLVGLIHDLNQGTQYLIIAYLYGN